MKLFNIDWLALIERLGTWNQLPFHVREAYCTHRANEGIDVAVIGGCLDLVIEQHLVRPPDSQGRVKLHPEARDFSKAVRAMARDGLADEPTSMRLMAYIQDNFTRPEQQALQPGGAVYHATAHALAECLVDYGWVNEFLREKDLASWESRRLTGLASYRTWFADPHVADAAKKLVRHLVEALDWIRLEDLPARLSAMPKAALRDAIHAAIRYGLVFPSMRRDELVPLIGVWPTVAAHLNRPSAKYPTSLPSEQIRDRYETAFLVDDMTAVLVLAVGDSLRLKTDGSLFSKARQLIEARFNPLPQWFVSGEWFRHSGPTRVDSAIRFLEDMKLARTTGKRAANFALTATEAGEAWLAASPKEQIQQVIAHLTRSQRRAYAGYWDLWIVPIGYDTLRLGEERVRGWLEEAWAPLERDQFLPLAPFLRWHAETENPLKDASVRQRVQAYGYGAKAPTDQHLESRWTSMMAEFLATRLIPLGGVCMARLEDGQLCFALTDIGRYLFGKVEDFEYGLTKRDGGQVLVQPNFEVTFLAPFPAAEAAMSRLAERCGHGVGTLFRITRGSIWEAAATGVKADAALETLRAVASQPLPANVEREIAGWFEQCRRVSVRKTVLVSCPDAETAARVASAGGRNASLLTETLVEISSQKAAKELKRKLRKSGIFVDSTRG